MHNGTLVVRDVRRYDSGVVSCGAVNDAGSLVARTRLEVAFTPAPPPVVIEVGPANQTLPLRSPAALPCQAEGQPVRWSKDGSTISPAARISFSDSGTLRIEDLQLSDAGSYTCHAGRLEEEQQQAAWTASLAVSSPTNPNVVFVRSPSDPMALPGSPSQPRLVSKSSNSLTISWQSGSRMGASALLGYTVEVFSSYEDDRDDEHIENSEEEVDRHSWSQTPLGWSWAAGDDSGRNRRAWRVVARRLKSDQYTLTDLKPSTWYTFLVRAENSHGLSLPSPVSPWFTTLPSGGAGGGWQSPGEVEEARRRLSAPWLRLDQVKAVNATSMRLTWQVLDGDGIGDGDTTIQGINVWYRPVQHNAEYGDDEAFQVTPVTNPTMSQFILNQLSPATRYQFFLVPFYRTIDGKPSNCKIELTLEAGWYST